MHQRDCVRTAMRAAFLLTAGLAALPSPAAAQVWTALGPEGGVVDALAVDPSDPATVYAGTFGGLFRSFDGGASWTVRTPETTPGGLTNLEPRVLAVDPSDPSILYAGTSGAGVFRSSDRGATWRSTGLAEAAVVSLVLDPTSPTPLYAAAGRSVFKSGDGGQTWAETRPELAVPGQPALAVTAVAVDPARPSTVFAGTVPFSLFKSTDGGASWVVLSSGLPPYLPTEGGGVNALAIDRDGTVFLVANSAGIAHSRDGGASWSRTLEAELVRTLQVHSDGTIYAGGDSLSSIVYAGTLRNGVFRSTDGGGNWSPLSAGLTDLSISTLAAGEDGSLFAGTIGGGAFRLDGR